MDEENLGLLLLVGILIWYYYFREGEDEYDPPSNTEDEDPPRIGSSSTPMSCTTFTENLQNYINAVGNIDDLCIKEPSASCPA